MNERTNEAQFESTFEQLEERVLFDGVPDATFLQPDANAPEMPTADNQSAATVQMEGQRELVIVDPNAEDADALVASILESAGGRSVEIHTLDGDSDGISQISELLANRDGRYDTVHLVTDGEDGELQIGVTRLNEENVGRYVDQLAQWSTQFREGAELKLHGAELDSYAAGENLLDSLAAVTGVSVSDETTADNVQIIFVDGGVADTDALIEEATSGFDDGVTYEIYNLSLDSDGLLQIGDVLDGRVGIDAIHIISHGDEGEVRLGNSVVTADNLSQYEAALSQWSAALSEDADILFYGCELAGNAEGEQFITSVSEITGADVAASDDLTGAEFKGGDWDLERHVGTIETQSLTATSWDGILADADGDMIDDVDDIDDDNDGILDSQEIGAGAVPSGSADTISFNVDSRQVYLIGGNSDGLGFQESGFEQRVLALGGTLETIQDFEGAAGASLSFSNGTISVASDASASTPTVEAGTGGGQASGDSGNSSVTVRPGDASVEEEDTLEFALAINFTDPVFSVGLDLNDIFDHGAADSFNDSYNIFANGQLLWSLQGASVGSGETGSVTVIDALGEQQGLIVVGENTEAFLGILSVDAITQIRIVGASEHVGDNSGQDIFGIDNLRFVRTQGFDTDGDGVAETFDLDSDNDGISDLFESGTSAAIIAADTDGNGSISIAEAEAILGVGNADTDGDGLLDIFENGDLSANVGTTPVDSDGDEVDDFLDLDSDNDLIADTIEARASTGYANHANDGSDNVDTDGDGILDRFDTNAGASDQFGGTDSNFVNPLDTDSDGTPDFLDADSDGDGLSDRAESGLDDAATNSDADNDGIDDGLQTSFADPDGAIDNLLSDLANMDSDASDADFRSVNDADGDNVADSVDIDDDNDGILDTQEGLQSAVALNLDPADLTFTEEGNVGDIGDQARYVGAGNLNGTLFDVQLTVTGNSDPNNLGVDLSGFVFNGDLFPILLNGSSRTGNVDIEFAFLATGTNDPIEVPARITFQDIDVGESVTFATEDLVEYQLARTTDITTDINASNVTFASTRTASGITEESIWLAAQLQSRESFSATFSKRTGNTGYIWGSDTFTDGAAAVQVNPVEVSPEDGRDTDGDGIADHRDLDSDNDGISDLFESGNAAAIALDSNGDGSLDLTESLDSDGDGLLDIFENANPNSPGGTTPVDSDGDDVDDFLDLDSDNDGIADAIEARPTADYVANDGDVTNDDSDGDGILDQFDANREFGGTADSLVVPEDTDEDGTPDFLDDNSDNDDLLDSEESGLTLSDDSNGDGIADNVAADGYQDPDGVIVTPFAQLQNTDSNPLDVDFRSVNLVAVNDSYTVIEDGSVALDPLFNDESGVGVVSLEILDIPDSLTEGVLTYVDGVTGDTSIVAPETTLSRGEADSLRYVAADDFNGPVAAIRYEVTDTNGQTSRAVIRIAVTATPDAVDDAIVTSENTSVDVALLDNDDVGSGVASVTINEIPNGSEQGTLTYTDTDEVVALVSSGSVLTLAEASSLRFTPVDDFRGVVPSISYTLTDTNGATSDAVVEISVIATLTASADSIVTNEDTSVVFNPLSNDEVGSDAASVAINTIPDGAVEGVLTYTDVAGMIQAISLGSVLTPAEASSLRFTPVNDFNGVLPSISYTVTDINGETSEADIDITVVATPDAVDDSLVTNENTSVALNILDNDDSGSGVASVTISDIPNETQEGTLTYTDVSGTVQTVDRFTVLSPDEATTLTFRPVVNFNGTVQPIQYTLADINGQTSESTINISVIVTPDATDDRFVIAGDTPVSLDPLGNDDLGLGVVSVTVNSVPDQTTQGVLTYVEVNDGLVTINSGDVLTPTESATLVFVPVDGFSGSAVSVGYSLRDINGITSDAVITIDIADVGIAKSVAAAVPNGDNFDVTFTLVYQNTGTVRLQNPSLSDDVRSGFADAFVGISDVSLVNFNGTGTPPAINSGWAGDTSADILSGGTIDAGDRFEVIFTVTIDPDASGTSTELTNSATGGGTAVDANGNVLRDRNGDTVQAIDVSDDGSDPNGENGNELTDDRVFANDVTLIQIADVRSAKALIDVPQLLSNDNYAVTYQVIVENTGTVDLANLSINEDLRSQFGSSLVGVSGLVLSAAPTNSASSINVANTDWNGLSVTEVLDTSTAILAVGDSFTVQFTVEVDPDAVGAPDELSNQVRVTADGVDANGDVILNPNGIPLVTTDLSDSGTDPNGTNDDADINAGGADDATRLYLPSVGVAKQADFAVPNGENLDVTFTLTYENTGSTVLTNLTLVDDLAAQFGDQFVGVSGLTVQNFAGTGTAPTANDSWASDTSQNLLVGGTVDQGDSFEVTFIVTVAPTANGSFGGIQNQATGSGDALDDNGDPLFDGNGNPFQHTDVSDDGTDPTSENGSDNSDGVPSNDPTPILFADLGIAKSVVEVSDLTFDGRAVVTFQLVVENTGTADLEELSLLEDLSNQFGPAFLDAGNLVLVSAPTDGDSSITLNSGGWNGSNDFELVDTTAANRLASGDRFVIEITVEVDALALDQPVATQVVGTATAVDENGNVILDGDGNAIQTVDVSDNGTEATSENGESSDDGIFGNDPTIVDVEIDPAGFFYDIDTGEILTGGSITVTGPSPGSVNLVDAGSDGSYQFFGREDGIYTVRVTAPPGFRLDLAAFQNGSFDPTGLGSPVSLGATDADGNGVLDDTTVTDYFLRFDLEAGDPIVINNNLPFQRLPETSGATGNPPNLPSFAPLAASPITNLLNNYTGSPGPIYSGREVIGGYSGAGGKASGVASNADTGSSVADAAEATGNLLTASGNDNAHTGTGCGPTSVPMGPRDHLAWSIDSANQERSVQEDSRQFVVTLNGDVNAEQSASVELNLDENALDRGMAFDEDFVERVLSAVQEYEGPGQLTFDGQRLTYTSDAFGSEMAPLLIDLPTVSVEAKTGLEDVSIILDDPENSTIDQDGGVVPEELKPPVPAEGQVSEFDRSTFRGSFLKRFASWLS